MKTLTTHYSIYFAWKGSSLSRIDAFIRAGNVPSNERVTVGSAS